MHKHSKAFDRFYFFKGGKKFEGLINVSGFHVDPGWNGHLVYAVYNAGPRAISLSRGEDLFLIWFAELDQCEYDPKYVRKDGKIQKGLKSELISGVSDPTYSMQRLSREIDKAHNKITTVYAIGALFIVFITILNVVIINWNKIRGLFNA
ncbi:hypothetical protein [Euryhalocaulis caribicus]|uniref:hypothetical protein n=1 Tax=Euryhalocaulis caribicus TaxID=1161401 RepID=UPI0012696157|nr:hypothetical protein [Euryhalocaulis caribicus]